MSAEKKLLATPDETKYIPREIFKNWDAQNKWSVASAEKLGYHFSHEYAAYEILGY